MTTRPLHVTALVKHCFPYAGRAPQAGRRTQY